ncbi:hypothetical protein JQX13_31820 [Archangium violaceum]|uniref:hypothetical protein n=1 Tax=Archangium violaceum TaxID=83451 RepID=UPI00193B4073|nr:hypothetical protein [Archangium violaceum]QRK04797.1 hypothetical protein JQX13_31820 [Archangium violaceum]
MRNHWFPLVAGLLLTTAAAAASRLPLGPTDQIEVTPHEEGLELSWSDTEERLQGSIRPTVPRKGQPLHVSLQVGSFEGDPFEGPLILTLREAGALHGQSLTVKRGERHWEATFTPESEGPYLLDVGFLTTRHKVLHAAFTVGASPVPRAIAWGVLGVGCLALIGYTVRGLLKGDAQKERPLPASAEESVPPASPPVDSAPEAAAPSPTDTPEAENKPPVEQ